MGKMPIIAGFAFCNLINPQTGTLCTSRTISLFCCNEHVSNPPVKHVQSLSITAWMITFDTSSFCFTNWLNCLINRRLFLSISCFAFFDFPLRDSSTDTNSLNVFIFDYHPRLLYLYGQQTSHLLDLIELQPTEQNLFV